MANDFGITLDDAVSDMRTDVEDAVNFLASEFEGDWSRAEKYYAGGSDLPLVKGRSKVVKTEVRDTVRALKPSVMRVLLHARKPVEYIPNTIGGADLAEQQALFVTQLFWQSGGYQLLQAVLDECLLKKGGFVKTYWEENPRDVFSKGTGLTMEAVAALESNPTVTIEEMKQQKSDAPKTGADAPAEVEEIPLFDVSWRREYPNGRIRMEAVPTYEVFFSRNANTLGGAHVHGHRREVFVYEAIEMGLESDDWESFDDEDPEQSRFAEGSFHRRGYQKNDDEDLNSTDLASKKFLLTECYARLDLDGTGSPKNYVFWLGGTSYKYIDHEEVEEWGLDCIQTDPVAFTVLGRSIPDLVANEQDTSTSLLRAMLDNAHMANNPRPIANPMLVDFADLMNNSIGAPIKSKAGGVVDYSLVPFTGGQLLPLLSYMEQDVQNKTGVTKAAQGLDPDAMQSTDKEAVKNTIMLAQGQVELIVRNLVEGLIPVFARLLRLSIRHMDPVQMIQSKGQVVPVAPAMFDPDLVAEPKVGLGTASPELKLSALNFVLAKQEQILSQFGLDNPFTSLSQMYNTLEDLTEASGLHNVGRYFKVVTPQIEAQLAKQRAEAEKAAQEDAKANAPMDPSKALTIIEGGKSKVKEAEIAAKASEAASKLELEALKAQEELDLRRDQMVQDRVLDIMKLEEQAGKASAEDRIKREQLRNDRRKIPLVRTPDAPAKVETPVNDALPEPEMQPEMPQGMPAGPMPMMGDMK